MKKIILMLAVVGTFSFAFANEITNQPSGGEHKAEISGKKITLINDTSEKLKIHTGSGSVSLNPRGGKTSFSCNPGKKVKADGKVIFKVTDDMCGKTIKLSKYL